MAISLSIKCHNSSQPTFKVLNGEVCSDEKAVNSNNVKHQLLQSQSKSTGCAKSMQRDSIFNYLFLFNKPTVIYDCEKHCQIVTVCILSFEFFSISADNILLDTFEVPEFFPLQIPI